MRTLALAGLLAAALHAQYFTLDKQRLTELTRDSPYARFDDGRPNVPADVLEKMRGLSVEEIWGVLPGKGYQNQYEGDWKLLHPDMKLVGRAVTAQFMPLRPDLHDLVIDSLRRRSFTASAHQWVMDQLRPGDVFVADMFGKQDGGSVMGDNLATAIKAATVNGGVVVDGAVRDLEGITPVRMPVYYRHSHPSANAQVTLTGYNTPIRIGRATVLPGDIVFGDKTGVYFVPPKFAKEILDKAEETHIHDEWTKRKFETGKYKTSELYPRPKDKALIEEYEAYKKQRLGR